MRICPWKALSVLVVFAACGTPPAPRAALLPRPERVSSDPRVIGIHAPAIDPEAVLTVERAAWLIAEARAQKAALPPVRPAVYRGSAGQGRAPGPVLTGSGSVNGYPCGGALPSCCTLRAESGGDPTAQNPSSSSSGLWQFTHDTWAGYGGYSEAKYAPAAVQNARAVQVFAGGSGASNWFGDGCYNGR